MGVTNLKVGHVHVFDLKEACVHEQAIDEMCFINGYFQSALVTKIACSCKICGLIKYLDEYVDFSNDRVIPINGDSTSIRPEVLQAIRTYCSKNEKRKKLLIRPQAQ